MGKAKTGPGTRRQYPWNSERRMCTYVHKKKPWCNGFRWGEEGGGLNLQSCRCKNVTRRRLYTASDSFGSKDTILIQRLPLLLQCINEKYRTKNFSSLVDSFYRRRGYRLSRRNDSSRILHRDFRKSSRSRSDHARTRYNTPSEMGEIQRSNSLEIIHRSIYIYKITMRKSRGYQRKAALLASKLKHTREHRPCKQGDGEIWMEKWWTTRNQSLEEQVQTLCISKYRESGKECCRLSVERKEERKEGVEWMEGEEDGGRFTHKGSASPPWHCPYSRWSSSPPWRSSRSPFSTGEQSVTL